MILAIGRTFFTEKLMKDKDLNQLYVIYPRFFDDKKSLLSSKGYGNYLAKLWNLRNTIEIAVYPDNVTYQLSVPPSLRYIYVIHELKRDKESFFRLRNNLNLIAGYASDQKYRDYSLDQFLDTFREVDKWYLGISTKHELREAVENNFEYGDITLMAIGSFKDLRSFDNVKRLLIKFYNHKNEIEKQAKIDDFIQK